MNPLRRKHRLLLPRQAFFLAVRGLVQFGLEVLVAELGRRAQMGKRRARTGDVLHGPVVVGGAFDRSRHIERRHGRDVVADPMAAQMRSGARRRMVFFVFVRDGTRRGRRGGTRKMILFERGSGGAGSRTHGLMGEVESQGRFILGRDAEGGTSQESGEERETQHDGVGGSCWSRTGDSTGTEFFDTDCNIGGHC